MVKQLTWQVVGLIAVLGAIAIGLAAFTKWAPGEILGLVGVLAGLGGGAAVAGGVSGKVEQMAEQSTANTDHLQEIKRKVNGELDGRIAAAVDKGNVDLLAQLEHLGVVRRGGGYGQ